MANQSNGLKRLVIFTLLFAIIITTFTLFKKHYQIEKIDTQGLQVLGNTNAPVRIVAVEALECPHCKRYMESVYPDLKKKYIDTGKANYTPVLISLMHFDVAAQAAYCIHKQNPDAFFPFIDLAYQHQPKEGESFWSIPSLLVLAKSIPGVNTETLHKCLDNGEYTLKIEMNYEKVVPIFIRLNMGTPAIFVNGILVHPLTESELFKVIENQLQKNDGR